VGQAQADGAVEGVFGHPEVVAVAAPLEVDRSHQIDRVEFVGSAGLRPGILLARQQGGAADPRRGQAVAPQDAGGGTVAGPGGGGGMPRVFNSAQMAVAPVRLERVAGAAWACNRQRTEAMALSNAGGMRWATW